MHRKTRSASKRKPTRKFVEFQTKRSKSKDNLSSLSIEKRYSRESISK